MVMLLITVHQGETDEHKVKILTNNRKQWEDIRGQVGDLAVLCSLRHFGRVDISFRCFGNCSRGDTSIGAMELYISQILQPTFLHSYNICPLHFIESIITCRGNSLKIKLCLNE